MKVFHLISGADAGGAATHVLSLLRELNKTHEIMLLCLGDGPLARRAGALGLPCRILSGRFLDALRQVSALGTEGEFALLHCHGARANLTGVLAKRRLGRPVASTVHSDPRLDYLGRPLAGAVYGALNAWALRRMDALVCVSEAMAALLRRRGFRGRRLFTIHNGVDYAAPRRVPVREERGEALGLPVTAEDVLVGVAARLEAVKELSTLLRGFAMTRQPRLKLVIAGTGPEEGKLRSLAQDLGIHERVFFPGWVEDMEGFYAALDAAALSSRWETFPYALTMAARYAVPVAATAVGGIPELVEDGVSGFLVPRGDAAALGRALDRLGSDAALRRRLGEALRAKGESRFSLTAMGRRQEEIYRCVLHGRPRAVVAGACGRGNWGDEAMLSGLLEELRQLAPLAHVTVLSHAPRETAALHGVEALHYLRLRTLACRCRGALFLSGGGNLLQDLSSRRSLWYYLLTLRIARKNDGRAMLWSAGLGPLSPAGLERTAAVLNRCARVIVFREEESLSAARAAGVTAPELLLGGDSAFDAPLPTPPEGTRRPRALLCPRPRLGTKEELMRLGAAFAALCRERGWEPLFLAMDRREDAALVRAMAEAAGLGPESALVPEDAARCARELWDARWVLSARLHALVLAVRGGVPCAGLATDARISAFLNPLGLPWRGGADISPQALAPLLEASLAVDKMTLARGAEAAAARLAVQREALRRALEPEE